MQIATCRLTARRLPFGGEAGPEKMELDLFLSLNQRLRPTVAEMGLKQD